MRSGGRLRIGVIGLGFASALTLPEIANHPRFRLTAATDLRPHALDRFASDYGGATFASVEELCASPTIDVVYVSTPNYLHADHAVMAAQEGKHLLVEKPLGVSVADCDRMLAAAHRNGVHLQYGHTHAYDPPIRAAATLVSSGELGRLLMLNSWNFTDILLRPRDAWELDARRGGGVVYIQAPHQVDIAREIAGPLASVRARAEMSTERSTEGSYVAYVEFAKGNTGTLVYSGRGYFDTAELHAWVGEDGLPRHPSTHARSHVAKRDRTSTAAEAGAREARRYGATRPVARRAGRRRQPTFGISLVSCERGDIRQSPAGLWVYDAGGRREVLVKGMPSGRRAMLDELCAVITAQQSPVHDGEWGRATVEACQAILRSSRTGRAVRLRSSPAPTSA
jgi:phthalate 4,5-cis-dihydrodiol dehydrogenase